VGELRQEGRDALGRVDRRHAPSAGRCRAVRVEAPAGVRHHLPELLFGEEHQGTFAAAALAASEIVASFFWLPLVEPVQK
jgi:hypothetical protein